MKQLNLNSTIRFRLKDSNFLKNKDFLIFVDPLKDGWYSTQLWEFMRLFGPAMIMGNTPVIELDILIEDADIQEVAP